MRGPLNCRSLRFGRDDKGEDGTSMESGRWTEGVFITLSGPKGMKNCFCSLLQQLLSMEALSSPLSSRPKWRDLQFSGPLVEMFFDRAQSRISCRPAVSFSGSHSFGLGRVSQRNVGRHGVRSRTRTGPLTGCCAEWLRFRSRCRRSCQRQQRR